MHVLYGTAFRSYGWREKVCTFCLQLADVKSKEQILTWTLRNQKGVTV